MVGLMGGSTLILIPPSEAKAQGGTMASWRAGTMAIAELDRRRQEVLRAIGPRQGQKLGPTMAAIERYVGVLYKELDAASLESQALERLNRDTLIVSGLWGLVAPTDPIPAYRMKMSASVAPLGKLSTWWRPHVTKALVARVDAALVWDLLPIEHSASVDWSKLAPEQRVTVRFVDSQGKTVNHWNKLLKGSLVRWLAQSAPSEVDALEGFDHPQGYVWDPDATELEGPTTRLTFTQRS